MNRIKSYLLDIRRKDVKKIKIAVSVIVVLILGFWSYSIYQKNKADERINRYLVEQGIPEEQIKTIAKIRYDEKPGLYKRYSKKITTKKDFKKWQQEVIKSRMFFSGEELKAKENLIINNCELEYDCVLDLKNKRVTVQYLISGDGITNQQEINSQFSYPLLNE